IEQCPSDSLSNVNSVRSDGLPVARNRTPTNGTLPKGAQQDPGASYLPSACIRANQGGNADTAAWGVISADGVALAERPAPADRVALAERDNNKNTTTTNNGLAYINGRYIANMTSAVRGTAGTAGGYSGNASCSVTNRHNDGANYLMTDGHAKYFARKVM